MGIGCLTISLAALLVHWLFDAEPPMKAISGLGRISAYLLSVYLVLRFAEILFSGEAGLLLERSWDNLNFWIEIALSALIPVAFLFRRQYRESKTAMFWIAACATVGMSLNRVNVAGLATVSLTQSFYFPAWTEWALSLGVLSAAGLVYLFCVEHFNLFEGVRRENVLERHDPGYLDHTDWAALFFQGQRWGEIRIYSLVFILALAASVGFLSNDSVYGVSPRNTPTYDARMVDVYKVPNRNGPGVSFLIGEPDEVDPYEEMKATVLMIDGNRDGRYVLFDHDAHADRLGRFGDRDTSCVLCHHMNKPFNQGTRCFECHSDMYLPFDIFDHQLHMDEHDGNAGCVECHKDPNLRKFRGNSTDCLECHKGMRPEGSRVNVTDPRKRNLASGYMDAMHELCISCHEETQHTLVEPDENFSRCTHCHRGLPGMDDEVWDRYQ
jgi:hypothetical protein